jgi:hypothetical protein
MNTDGGFGIYSSSFGMAKRNYLKVERGDDIWYG